MLITPTNIFSYNHSLDEQPYKLAIDVDETLDEHTCAAGESLHMYTLLVGVLLTDVR